MLKDNKDVDFKNQPIIILGVGHSGTRVVVDILSTLGSDGGNCKNQWRENEFFIDLHKILLNVNTQEEWTKKIFTLETYYGFQASEESKDVVRKKLSEQLKDEYPSYCKAAWHWKCPTSAVFMDFWLDIFPDAYYIHIVRDPLDVAGSLLRRKQFPNVRTALLFYKAMDELIIRNKPKNYLKLDYNNLKSEVPYLVDFLPFLDKSKIDIAADLIHENVSILKKGARLRVNLMNFRAYVIIKIVKLAHSLGLYRI